MPKMSRKFFVIVIPVMALAMVMFFTTKVAGEGDSLPAAKDKMTGIMEKQSETLQKLFVQAQKIEEMETKEKEIAGDIAKLQTQLEDLQRSISDEETAYAKKKENLKQLLQSYQRMGPGSYLEIIFESTNLSDFLRRINVLRDITRNTGRLIDELQSSKEKQLAAKTKLTDELATLTSKQVQFNESLAQETQLRKELEDYLASLSAERAYYEKYLIDLKNQLNELKPFFSKAVKEFANKIVAGNLPPDTIKLTFNFLSIKGAITDKSLNQIMAGEPGLPEIVFSFQPGDVELRVPAENLVLDGTFVIQDGNALLFKVKDGSFYGIPLETSTIEDLFQDGDMMFNLKSLLGDYILDSLEIRDGYLEFSISPGL